jgi:hypothetical protein
MTPDVYAVLEAVLGSAVGAGATFTGIWFLFFKARVEHLQAISAPNLAKELEKVSQWANRSSAEKLKLQQQLDESNGLLADVTGVIWTLRKELFGLKTNENRLSDTMLLNRLLGIAEGSQEASKRLGKSFGAYFDAVVSGEKEYTAEAFFETLKSFDAGLSKFIQKNIYAAESKAKSLSG